MKFQTLLYIGGRNFYFLLIELVKIVLKISCYKCYKVFKNLHMFFIDITGIICYYFTNT